MSVEQARIAALELRIAHLEGRFAEQDAQAAHHAAGVEEQRRKREQEAVRWRRARVRERATEVFRLAREVQGASHVDIDPEIAAMVREQHDQVVAELEAIHLEEAAERVVTLGLSADADLTPFIQPVERVFE